MDINTLNTTLPLKNIEGFIYQNCNLFFERNAFWQTAIGYITFKRMPQIHLYGFVKSAIK